MPLGPFHGQNQPQWDWHVFGQMSNGLAAATAGHDDANNIVPFHSQYWLLLWPQQIRAVFDLVSFVDVVWSLLLSMVHTCMYEIEEF